MFQRLTQAFASFVTATLIIVTLFTQTSLADDPASDISDHIQFGEFSKAIELANELPQRQADQSLAKISQAQSATGANVAAQETIESISQDKVRFKALAQQPFFGGPAQFRGNPLGGNQFGGNQFGQGFANQNGNFGPGQLGGRAGGITQADFQPLINLIRSTIDPDGWDDTNGDGSILAYPAGVYADSQGTLKRIKIDSRRSLTKLAQKASKKTSNRGVDQKSSLRKVSLNRLEKTAQMLASQGHAIPDTLQNMAGIYEIEYLMYLPESNDIVIAGPAGSWQTDNDGHAINSDTHKPLLQLDDLVICLRNAQFGPRGNNGKFGCSITPRKENLVATNQYISTSNLKGKAWRSGLREVLGKQDIEVFGIDAATHAGSVLIEADYRMKLVAMGLEPSIPEIPSYLSRLAGGENGQPMDVVRWWFTMNYDDIFANEEREVFELNGTGVKVLSENEFIDQQGERIHTGKSDAPTAGFASDFTRHFEKIADQYPCYHRLKNLFDLSIVSALVKRHGLARKANWNLTYFGNDPEYAGYVYQPATAPVPTQVDSVMNHRLITRRKKSSTVKETLVGVSGGITFDAVNVLNSKTSLADDTTELNNMALEANDRVDLDAWWWD